MSITLMPQNLKISQFVILAYVLGLVVIQFRVKKPLKSRNGFRFHFRGTQGNLLLGLERLLEQLVELYRLFAKLAVHSGVHNAFGDMSVPTESEARFVCH